MQNNERCQNGNNATEWELLKWRTMQNNENYQIGEECKLIRIIKMANNAK